MKRNVFALLAVFYIGTVVPVQAADTVPSKAVWKIVQKIAKFGKVTTQLFGEGVEPSRSGTIFNNCARRLRRRNCVSSLNNRSPVVRCYAFWALAYDPATDVLDIILHHIVTPHGWSCTPATPGSMNMLETSS